MEVTGQILKQNREKSQISLSEVSMATKINLKVLEAIESGDKSQLPAPSFLRGFVRTYAKYLKLDETMIMQSFDEEIGNSRPKHQAPPMSEVEAEKPEQILRSRTLTSKYFAAGTIVILIFAILFIRKVVDKYEKETLLPTTEDIHQIAKIDPPAEPDLKVDEDPEIPEKDSTSKEDNSTNKIAIATNKPEKSREDLTKNEIIPPPLNPKHNVTPTANPLKPDQVVVPSDPTPTQSAPVPSAPVTDTTSSSIPIPEEVAPAPARETAETNEDEIRQELIIEALDNTKVQMVLDNGKSSVLNLKASDVHIVKAQSKIKVILSDGGAVSIIHNGQNRGVPGDLGKSLTLNFD